MGEIGPVRRDVEFEPLPDTAPEPIREPAPAAPVPEKVPA